MIYSGGSKVKTILYNTSSDTNNTITAVSYSYQSNLMDGEYFCFWQFCILWKKYCHIEHLCSVLYCFCFLLLLLLLYPLSFALNLTSTNSKSFACWLYREVVLNAINTFFGYIKILVNMVHLVSKVAHYGRFDQCQPSGKMGPRSPTATPHWL